MLLYLVVNIIIIIIKHKMKIVPENVADSPLSDTFDSISVHFVFNESVTTSSRNLGRIRRASWVHSHAYLMCLCSV